jgi:hypothetical protein
MYDLTGFQRDLLYAIAGQDEPKGLAIKNELDDYYEREIFHADSIRTSIRWLRKDWLRRVRSTGELITILTEISSYVYLVD